MHIVLVEPEIPQNTGNIARTCAATGSSLHLIRPLGFSVDDRQLKRAGLDYWHLLDIHYHDSFQQLQDAYPEGKFFYATTKGGERYTELSYPQHAFLVFGKETKGLPPELLGANPACCLRVPMLKDARSLNLANTVAVVIYEALRQQNFPGLS
ncbi:MAG: tRNA (uridine(34)/cytosine(34)/5-carboxymethylaminomethyluridine(34)-2'-O)-methyltransferase TrmL [Carboxydocellales bacterium]